MFRLTINSVTMEVPKGSRIVTATTNREILGVSSTDIVFTNRDKIAIKSLAMSNTYVVVMPCGTKHFCYVYFNKRNPPKPASESLQQNIALAVKAMQEKPKLTNPCKEVDLESHFLDAVSYMQNMDFEEAEKKVLLATRTGRMHGKSAILAGKEKIAQLMKEFGAANAAPGFDIPQLRGHEAKLVLGDDYFDVAKDNKLFNEEITMEFMSTGTKQATPLTEKKFDVLGVNIYKASADTLIALIHDVQGRIDKFNTLPVESTYADAKVAELDKAMRKVVKELDSRAS